MKSERLTKIFTAAVVAAMLLSSCGGTASTESGSSAPAETGSSGTTSSAEPQETVVLEYYNRLDPVLADVDMVWDAINEYLEEKINVRVNYHFFTAADYTTKMSAMVSSGQEIDVLHAGSAFPFINNAQKGAFYDIKDLLPEYAPETVEMLPQGLWDAVTIDGKIYGIPSYKDNCRIYNFIYNKDMAEDLGVDADITWGSFKDLIPLLYEGKEKRDAKYPEDAGNPIMSPIPLLEYFFPSDVINGLAVTNIPGINAFEGQGEGETVFNKYATPEFREYCQTMKQLSDDGILYGTITYETMQAMLQDGKIFSTSNAGLVTINPHLYSQDFEMVLNNSTWMAMYNTTIQSAVTAVSSRSRNPESALRFLNLVNTDPWLATTLRFGLEGEHYVRDENNRITFEGSKRNSDPSNYGYYYWYGWQFGSLFNIEIPATESDDLWNLIETANEESIQDTNLGFVFDTTAVTNEIAACTSVISEYETSLIQGQLPNVDEILDEFLEKLERSGSEKIVEEAQRQLTEWRKSVGKPV